MGRNTNKTEVSDTTIHAALRDIQPVRTTGPVVVFYSENEDQFLKLDTPITIPSLPVHHTMNNTNPPEGYREAILGIVEFLGVHTPNLLAGTRWSFDPRSILAPTFSRVEEFDGHAYLYLVLIDLTCRTLEAEILEPGTNDRTPAYRSRRLYFEADYFPLNGLDADSLVINQTIPATWKGESGEGYMIHGIWMDADINKFFSKLVLPAGTRNHPYYPVTCKQHSVSMNALDWRTRPCSTRYGRTLKMNWTVFSTNCMLTPSRKIRRFSGNSRTECQPDRENDGKIYPYPPR